jgi:hypothetical protein
LEFGKYYVARDAVRAAYQADQSAAAREPGNGTGKAA